MLILLATADEIDAMIAALQGRSQHLVRHRLTADAAAALTAAVADSPSAVPPR